MTRRGGDPRDAEIGQRVRALRLQRGLSQTELGSYLSISRENVSRQLGRLRDANVIAVNEQQIVISDEEGLAEIAASPS